MNNIALSLYLYSGYAPIWDIYKEYGVGEFDSIFNFIFRRKTVFCKGSFILWTISLGRVEIHSPKIFINFPCPYNKLHGKGEPYWISGKRDHSLQTNKKLTTLDDRIIG